MKSPKGSREEGRAACGSFWGGTRSFKQWPGRGTEEGAGGALPKPGPPQHAPARRDPRQGSDGSDLSTAARETFFMVRNGKRAGQCHCLTLCQ